MTLPHQSGTMIISTECVKGRPITGNKSLNDQVEYSDVPEEVRITVAIPGDFYNLDYREWHPSQEVLQAKLHSIKLSSNRVNTTSPRSQLNTGYTSECVELTIPQRYNPK